MKRLLIIIDGMDDEPVPGLRHLTPSRFACMPALRSMREKGVVSTQETAPPGNLPATDVALLRILGYDVPPGFSSRSWLEALGAGIAVGEGDLCLRCNLISHSAGVLTSHSGNNVSPDLCTEIIDRLNRHFGNGRLEFHNCGSFRNLLVVRDCAATVTAELPHTLTGAHLSRLCVRSDNAELADVLNRCIVESRNVLSDYPANGIALWAPGRLVYFSRRLRGAVVAGVNVVKGIGRAVGMSVVEVAGATGDEYTDYRAKLQAALAALERYDFVMLHIEATDEASHEKDSLKKVRILEEIDRQVLGPLLKEKTDLEVTLQSDHATSSLSGQHLAQPVEVIKYRITKDEK